MAVHIDRHPAAGCVQARSTVRCVQHVYRDTTANICTSLISLHVKRKTVKRCVGPLEPGGCGCGFERYKVGSEVLEGVDVVRSIKRS